MSVRDGSGQASGYGSSSGKGEGDGNVSEDCAPGGMATGWGGDRRSRYFGYGLALGQGSISNESLGQVFVIDRTSKTP